MSGPHTASLPNDYSKIALRQVKGALQNTSPYGQTMIKLNFLECFALGGMGRESRGPFSFAV
jgi:hypothetical protein